MQSQLPNYDDEDGRKYEWEWARLAKNDMSKAWTRWWKLVDLDVLIRDQPKGSVERRKLELERDKTRGELLLMLARVNDYYWKFVRGRDIFEGKEANRLHFGRGFAPEDDD